jgi:hypothetical protein
MDGRTDCCSDTASCNQNFTNLFIWADVYNQLVARINDYLVVKGSLGDDVKRYLFPTVLAISGR